MMPTDNVELEKVRAECIDLINELEQWDVRPFRKNRIALSKSICYSRNIEHLLTIHSSMNELLGKMMIEKLSQDLDD